MDASEILSRLGGSLLELPNMVLRVLRPAWAASPSRNRVTQVLVPQRGQIVLDSSGLGWWTNCDVYVSTLGRATSPTGGINVVLNARKGANVVRPGPAAVNFFTLPQGAAFNGRAVLGRGVGCDRFEVILTGAGDGSDNGSQVEIDLRVWGREPVGNAA